LSQSSRLEEELRSTCFASLTTAELQPLKINLNPDHREAKSGLNCPAGAT
jgi:hypothetical protein